MLRNLDASQHPFLLDAINRVFSRAVLPDQWHSAIVIPVLKQGKPLHSCIAEARNAFPPEECVFRPPHATADCITAIMSTLEQVLHNEEMAILLLLDIQSAFDSLLHGSIISAVRMLDVEGKPFNYVQAFLTNQTLFMCVGRLDGASTVWCSDVRHLGLTIDNCIRRFLVARHVRQTTRREASIVCCLLTGGNDCPNALACAGYSICSRVAETFAEARAWPASLTKDSRAVCHLERLYRPLDAGPLLTRLRAVPNFRVGQPLDVYDAIVANDPARPSRGPLPHRRAPL
ncbi:hypothetical protein MRX96_032482 [Rhipicephalus microplus]